uniref:(northern house mosquito) hypothetical protein n=1 Tax=Culex pipiens TaxID=7175 RepID=A0A8D8ASM5_CULPI
MSASTTMTTRSSNRDAICSVTAPVVLLGFPSVMPLTRMLALRRSRPRRSKACLLISEFMQAESTIARTSWKTLFLPITLTTAVGSKLMKFTERLVRRSVT